MIGVTTPFLNRNSDQSQRSALRWLALGLGAGAAAGTLLSVASSGLAVYFARRIVVPQNAPEETEILHVQGFDDEMVIHLPATTDTIVPGRYSLFFHSGRGHARIGDIIEYDPRSRTVARAVLAVDSGDLRRARWGHWSGVYYTGPEHAGVLAEDITLTSDIGDLPAWFLPTDAAQPEDTWAILIHGRGGTRAEGLRAAATLNALGVPAILPAYRNDAEVRRGKASRYGLGDTEWLDIDAAIEHALRSGASRVVLFGWSMGGAIALQAASRGRFTDRIAGLVLDAPVLDWFNVLDRQARVNKLPTPIARLVLEMITQPWARPFTGLDTPLDLKRMDWVTRAAELDVPVLLIHSKDDEFVPIEPSLSLAKVRADLVTMPEYDRAMHTKEWNVDPERWSDDVANFLESKILRRQDG